MMPMVKEMLQEKAKENFLEYQKKLKQEKETERDKLFGGKKKKGKRK